MIKKLISHNLAKEIKDYKKILKNLQKNFVHWEFKDLNGVASMKDSVHFHISKKKEKGVIEITLAPKLEGKILIDVKDNRTSEWTLEAVKDLILFLKK